MKTHTTLTLDIDLIEKAKTMNINISGSFNEYLKGLVLQMQDNSEGINIKLENLKLKKLQTQYNSVKVELDVCVERIKRYKELESKKEMASVKKEKDRIEALTKCINCGNLILGKFQDFPKGKVCQPCFMSNDEGVSKWR